MANTVEVPQYPACDFCGTTAHYDASVPLYGGTWANLCDDHFFELGPGRLGTGYGQKLVLSK
jgi:hypothetical protein